jgi:3-carboxy-cis,cis-muconate cycloisomerase
MPQEHERAAGGWHAEWEPQRELLRLVGAAASWCRDLLEHLEVDAGRMRANLDAAGGQPLAEAAVAALAGPLGRRRAREAVEAASRRAAEQGRPLREVLQASPEVAGRLGAAELDRALDRALDPAAQLGAAQALVDRALAAHARLDTTGEPP